MKRIYVLLTLVSLFFTSCNSEPTLQKYFVESAENNDFISIDLSPSILNIDKSKLTVEQSEALKSFDKVSILAFKLNAKNQAQFAVEKAKVVAILKNDKYQQLMKFGSGKAGASVSFVGDDNHIEEFDLYANQSESGFAVVRILGKDMNPNTILAMISVLQNANLNLDQLKPLQDLMKK
jgi:hypothetical protein